MKVKITFVRMDVEEKAAEQWWLSKRSYSVPSDCAADHLHAVTQCWLTLDREPAPAWLVNFVLHKAL